MTLSVHGARRLLVCASFTALAAGVAAPVAAQGGPDYSFEFTPYLWGANLNGDTSVGGLPLAHVEASFSDLLKNLDFGAMFIFEAKPKQGRLGLLVDGVYMKLTDDLTSGSPLASNFNGKFTQQYYAAALTYRVNDGPMALDLVGGVRYNDLRIRLEVTQGLLAPRTNEESKGWADGFIGARLVAPIDDKWSFVAYGDVGAGGSDSTWQVLLGGSYKVSDTGAVKFGYRFMAVDYDKDNFRWDMDTRGLYVGYTFKF
jgi:hypothetical protein